MKHLKILYKVLGGAGAVWGQRNSITKKSKYKKLWRISGSVDLFFWILSTRIDI